MWVNGGWSVTHFRVAHPTIGDKLWCADQPLRDDDVRRRSTSKGDHLVIQSVERIPERRIRFTGLFGTWNDLTGKHTYRGEVICSLDDHVSAWVRPHPGRRHRPPPFLPT